MERISKRVIVQYLFLSMLGSDGQNRKTKPQQHDYCDLTFALFDLNDGELIRLIASSSSASSELKG